MIQRVGVGIRVRKGGGLELEGIIVERIIHTILYITDISQTNPEIDQC